VLCQGAPTAPAPGSDYVAPGFSQSWNASPKLSPHPSAGLPGLTLKTSAWSSRDTSTKLLGAKSCAG